MSRTTRLIAAALAVAAAAVAFVALRPDDEGDTTATTTTTTVTTVATPAATTTAAAKPAAPAITTIRVSGGQPVGGVKSFTVRKGDQIRFRVVDDASANVHLHGYDVEKTVTPDAPASYSLPATIEGVFEIELEDTSVQIGKLTVEP